jgi:hypothetical protein
MLAVQQLPVLAAALLPIPPTQEYWAPGELFDSWTEDGTNITVPLASWPDMTAAIADATTGDSRKVVVSFCQQAFTWYNNLADRPTAVTVAYSPGRMQSSGDYTNKQKVEFKITAYLDYPSGAVTDEV